MKFGDRVKLTAEGRQSLSTERWDFGIDPEIRGTVVPPGVYRGGLRIRVKLDGTHRSKSYAKKYWELERASHD